MKSYLPAVMVWAVMWATNMALPAWHERTLNPPTQVRGRLDVMLDLLGESRTILARYLWYMADNIHEILEAQGVNVFYEGDVGTVLHMATTLDPKLEEAFDIIAWDLHKRGDDQKALDILREGLQATPDSFPLNRSLSIICIKSNRFTDECLTASEKMLMHAPDGVQQLNALRNIYHWYAGLNRWPEALQAVDAVLRVEPKNYLYLQERAKVLERLKEAKP